MKTDFKKGDKVLFGREFGEKTLGEVVKVNRSKLKVKQLDTRGTYKSYPVGTIWTVPPSLCQKADSAGNAVPEAPKPKRSEPEIMRNIQRLYSMLISPSQYKFSGDSHAQAAKRGVAFRRELRACFTELGRTVTGDEACRFKAVG